MNFLNKEELEKFVSDFGEKIEFENKLFSKYIVKFYNLSKAKRIEILEKIYIKYNSDSYKDRYYKKGCFPEYYLGEYLIEYGRLYGIEVESDLFFPEEKYIIEDLYIYSFLCNWSRYSNYNREI